MKPWSWRKAQVCGTRTCNGSVHACCNSSGHLQNWLFLPHSAKPGCWSHCCLHRALQDELLWCDKKNQKNLGCEAKMSQISPKLYFAMGYILLGLPMCSGQPWDHWHKFMGFYHFPYRKGFTTGWSSEWGDVPWCTAMLACTLPNSSHLCPNTCPASPLGISLLNEIIGPLAPVPKHFIIFHALA